MVRREVWRLQPTAGEHILVYVTSGFESLLEVLPEFSRETFRVYGYDRDGAGRRADLQPFSKDGFLADLATAKAVIATAGFTLISEALCLRKPYLALPMQGQFEQQLNGFQLQQLGYGKSVAQPTRRGDRRFPVSGSRLRGTTARVRAGRQSGRSRPSWTSCWPTTAANSGGSTNCAGEAEIGCCRVGQSGRSSWISPRSAVFDLRTIRHRREPNAGPPESAAHPERCASFGMDDPFGGSSLAAWQAGLSRPGGLRCLRTPDHLARSSPPYRPTSSPSLLLPNT